MSRRTKYILCFSPVELLISHMKSDYRMMRKCLNSALGNNLDGWVAYNMRRWMNKHAFCSFASWILMLVGRCENALFRNENKSTFRCSTLVVVS